MDLLPDIEPQKNIKMTNTFLGEMPSDVNNEMIGNKDLIKELLNSASMGPGMKLAGSAPGIAEMGANVAKKVKEVGEKAWEYIRPGAMAEQAEKFRGSLSPAQTSSENIANLSERTKFAKESSAKEALKPKEEIYAHHGESTIIPNKEISKYLNEEGTTEFYSKKGLLKKHNRFEENPTLNNYDSLQSALKKEIRRLKSKGKNLDTAGEEKLDSLENNVTNLNSDLESFVETLPPKMQDLERTFREKWRTGPAKYEDAKSTIQKLAKGKHSEVTDDQIVRTFTRPDENVKNIIKELGPSVGRNVLYSALVKVKPGNAKEMAETILELKRTKGFDNFITKDIEAWANAMLKQEKNLSFLKKAGGVLGTAAAGGAIGGPVGMVTGGIGALAYPFAKDFGKYISQNMRK